MKNDANTTVTRERVAKIIDDILDYTLFEIYNGDENKFKNSIYFNVNMFVLYIKFASKVRKTRYTSFIADLITYIEYKKEEIESKFNSNTIDMYNYFDGIISGVVR